LPLPWDWGGHSTPDQVCYEIWGKKSKLSNFVVFTCESSYCFQRVLAIAILSVCLSVCHMGGSVKNGAS